MHLPARDRFAEGLFLLGAQWQSLGEGPKVDRLPRHLAVKGMKRPMCPICGCGGTVDTHVSEACAVRRESAILSTRTNLWR